MLNFSIGVLVIASFVLTGFTGNSDDFAVKERLIGKFRISISLREVGTADDSLVLAFYDHPFSDSPSDNIPTFRIAKSCKDKVMVFEVAPAPIIGYYCIIFKEAKDKGIMGERIINFCPIMKGDSYSITISLKPDYKGYGKKYIYTAKGSGSATLGAFQDLEWARDTGHAGGSVFTDRLDYNPSNYGDDKARTMINALNRKKAILPLQVYNLLRIDAILRNKSWKYADFRVKYRFTKLPVEKEKLNAIYKQYLKDDSIDMNYFNSIATQVPAYIIEKKICDSYYDSGKVSYTQVYNSIVQEFSGKLRERTLIYLFKKHLSRIPYVSNLIEDSRKYISEGMFNQYLKNTQSIQTGSNAFNFKLTDKNKDTVRFSSFEGSVIFMDFWFTGCTPCKVFYKTQLKDVEEYYEKNTDVKFITVSVDKDYDKWRESLQGGEYTSERATNLYTGGLGDEHPIIKHYAISAYPRPLLIDQSGRIVNVGAINYLRDKKNIIHTIDSLLQKM